MLIALVVMAGIVLTVLVNNRRQPSRWDRDDRPSGWDGGSAGDGSAWAFSGGDDSGSDCSSDAGGGDCGDGGAGAGGGGGIGVLDSAGGGGEALSRVLLTGPRDCITGQTYLRGNTAVGHDAIKALLIGG